ncbi:minor capsid protein [Vagococcus sp. PNs007]|uniref:Minor capsid protein n=1 Tax=Vagococcus proximus TaxID=2991417 RepID=A0ABT5X2W5_9ENTE|nr:minor capsid protein [Vagococcus proximus]MDF0480267.1 minor capsid protein [Vagococcus proximus]
MDIYERVSEHLLKTVQLASISHDEQGRPLIYLRPIPDNECGIALLDAPSGTDERYQNRDVIYRVSMQIIVKNKQQEVAYQDAMAIYYELDNLPRFDTKGNYLTIESDCFQLIVCEGYTLPRLIEQTEHGAYLYTLLAKATIMIQPKREGVINEGNK